MLPNKEQVFDFEYTSELGKKYDGQFVVKVNLNMRERHALELEKTRLQGGYINPTDGLLGLSIMLATLRTKIVKAPEWWNQSEGGWNIEDEDAIVTLYRKVDDMETKWKQELRDKAKAAEKKDSASQTESKQ